MPKYNEKAVTGTSYERPARYVIDDPLGVVASMMTANERVIAFPDGSKIVEASGNSQMSFSNGALSIPLYNPTTGDAIAGQSITLAQAYRGLYSIWRYIKAQGG